jgi:uncharacterized protein YjbI with pentapeptide repeats
LYKNIFFTAFGFLLIQNQVYAFPPHRSVRSFGRGNERARSRSRSEERKEDHFQRRSVHVQHPQELQQQDQNSFLGVRSLKVSGQLSITRMRNLALRNPDCFRNLEHFDLSGECLVPHSHSDPYTGLDWRLLFSMNFEKLNSLNLSETDIADHDYVIDALMHADFPALKKLNLSGNDLTGMFAPFSDNRLSSTLQEMNLSGTQMQDEDLINFLKGSWKNLRSLDLSANDFSYHEVLKIIENPKNHELDSLRHINLSYAIHYPAGLAQQGKNHLKALAQAQNPRVTLEL